MRVYNLAKQELIKKLLSGVKWISDMVVHPSGDHVLLSSYDKRVVWFDMDLSAKPYKTLRCLSDDTCVCSIIISQIQSE